MTRFCTSQQVRSWCTACFKRALQVNQPITAVPNYGGNDGHGVTGFKITGDGPIPTPRQLVVMLDQYVIGQEQAKRVSGVASVPRSACIPYLQALHSKWNVHCPVWLLSQQAKAWRCADSTVSTAVYHDMSVEQMGLRQTMQMLKLAADPGCGGT